MTTAMGREMAQRERLNRELEIAREVQEHLFPQRLPAVPGLDYCGRCRPAREVGGDYYDFLELPEGRLGLAIGDVSGKGVGAALMMASLEASLRALAPVVEDPAELMERVNSLIFQASSASRYATLFYAQYDPATRRFPTSTLGITRRWSCAPAVVSGRSSGWRPVVRSSACCPSAISGASFLTSLATWLCCSPTESLNP